jgi:carnitine 3-dehydrogenase
VADVALLGGGVIGGGWAARFLLNGLDVRLYDPDPEAAANVQEMLANARRAYARLTLAPLPAEGSLAVPRRPRRLSRAPASCRRARPSASRSRERRLPRAPPRWSPRTPESVRHDRWACCITILFLRDVL